MKRFLVSLICAAVVATGCGVAKPTEIASVGSRSLSVATFNSLLKSSFITESVAQQLQQQNVGLTTTKASEVGGEKARFLVGLFVQTEQMRALVTDLGGKITAEDRSKAEEQLQQTLDSAVQSATQAGKKPLELSGAARKFILEFFVAGTALDRVSQSLATTPTSAEVGKYFTAHKADFANYICFEGVVVASETLLPQVRTAMEAGTPVADVVKALNDASTDGSPQAQVLSAQECFPESQIPGEDDPLGAPLHTAAIGALSEVKAPTQQGTVQGAMVRVKSRGPVGLDNNDVVAQITKTLGTDASAAVQKKVAKRSKALLKKLDVKIDPRYGKFDPKDPKLVVATNAILPASTTTTSAPSTLG